MIDPSMQSIIVTNSPSACYNAACSGTYELYEIKDGKPKYIMPTTYTDGNGQNRSYTCSVSWWQSGLKWIMDGPGCQALNNLDTQGVPMKSWEWEVKSIAGAYGK